MESSYYYEMRVYYLLPRQGITPYPYKLFYFISTLECSRIFPLKSVASTLLLFKYTMSESNQVPTMETEEPQQEQQELREEVPVKTAEQWKIEGN